MRHTTLHLAPLFAFAAVIAGCGRSAEEKTVQVFAPPLPAGKLQYLSGGIDAARYLAMDGIERADGKVTATLLVVGRGPSAIEQRFAMQTKRETIDCATQTVSDEVGGFYDLAGKGLETRILTGETGRPAEFGDTEAKVACNPAAVGKGRILSGWKAARRDAQAAPADLAARVEANPDDADGWAWLCAAAARGAWRPEAPKDCDKAVALLPDEAQVRIDRGYLSLKTGRNGQAAADFRAVAAKEPQNAAALFGTSLLSGMQGDMAASKRQRGPAFDADPQIDDWVVGTYRLQLTADYRTR